jgi:hypothetical protein
MSPKAMPCMTGRNNRIQIICPLPPTQRRIAHFNLHGAGLRTDERPSWKRSLIADWGKVSLQGSKTELKSEKPRQGWLPGLVYLQRVTAV